MQQKKRENQENQENQEKLKKLEKLVAIRGDVPESLRVRFKMACAERKVTINDTLAALVEAWIYSGDIGARGSSRNNASVWDATNFLNIPELLRAQFVEFCLKRDVTISDVLAMLIKKWNEGEVSGKKFKGDSPSREVINFFNALFSKRIDDDSPCLNPNIVKKVANYIEISDEKLAWLVKLILLINRDEPNEEEVIAIKRAL